MLTNVHPTPLTALATLRDKGEVGRPLDSVLSLKKWGRGAEA